MSRRNKKPEIQAIQSHMTEPAADCRQKGNETFAKSLNKVLEEPETIRKRPSIFIGEAAAKGLHHLVGEVVDTCIEQAVDNYCNDIQVIIESNQTAEVVNDDNESPENTPGKKHISALEVLKRVLHSGCKFQVPHYYSISDPDESPDKTQSQTLPDTDDSQIPEEGNKYRSKGRPFIKRLCSKFSDAAIWPMAKHIFQRIYNYSIQKATDIVQYLACFVCSLFRVSDLEEIDGRVSHFYRLVKDHLPQSMMPSLRKLQQSVQWLRDKKQVFFRALKETGREKEEAKHKNWETLEDRIFGIMQELAPQYATIS